MSLVACLIVTTPGSTGWAGQQNNSNSGTNIVSPANSSAGNGTQLQAVGDPGYIPIMPASSQYGPGATNVQIAAATMRQVPQNSQLENILSSGGNIALQMLQMLGGYNKQVTYQAPGIVIDPRAADQILTPSTNQGSIGEIKNLQNILQYGDLTAPQIPNPQSGDSGTSFQTLSDMLWPAQPTDTAGQGQDQGQTITTYEYVYHTQKGEVHAKLQPYDKSIDSLDRNINNDEFKQAQAAFQLEAEYEKNVVGYANTGVAIDQMQFQISQLENKILGEGMASAEEAQQLAALQETLKQLQVKQQGFGDKMIEISYQLRTLFSIITPDAAVRFRADYAGNREGAATVDIINSLDPNHASTSIIDVLDQVKQSIIDQINSQIATARPAQASKALSSDLSGALWAGGGTMATTLAFIAGANFWNPLGWTVAAVAGGVAAYGYFRYTNSKMVANQTDKQSAAQMGSELANLDGGLGLQGQDLKAAEMAALQAKQVAVHTALQNGTIFNQLQAIANDEKTNKALKQRVKDVVAAMEDIKNGKNPVNEMASLAHQLLNDGMGKDHLSFGQLKARVAADAALASAYLQNHIDFTNVPDPGYALPSSYNGRPTWDQLYTPANKNFVAQLAGSLGLSSQSNPGLDGYFNSLGINPSDVLALNHAQAIYLFNAQQFDEFQAIQVGKAAMGDLNAQAYVDSSIGRYTLKADGSFQPYNATQLSYSQLNQLWQTSYDAQTHSWGYVPTTTALAYSYAYAGDMAASGLAGQLISSIDSHLDPFFTAEGRQQTWNMIQEHPGSAVAAAGGAAVGLAIGVVSSPLLLVGGGALALGGTLYEGYNGYDQTGTLGGVWDATSSALRSAASGALITAPIGGLIGSELKTSGDFFMGLLRRIPVVGSTLETAGAIQEGFGNLLGRVLGGATTAGDASLVDSSMALAKAATTEADAVSSGIAQELGAVSKTAAPLAETSATAAAGVAEGAGGLAEVAGATGRSAAALGAPLQEASGFSLQSAISGGLKAITLPGRLSAEVAMAMVRPSLMLYGAETALTGDAGLKGAFDAVTRPSKAIWDTIGGVVETNTQNLSGVGSALRFFMGKNGVYATISMMKSFGAAASFTGSAFTKLAALGLGEAEKIGMWSRVIGEAASYGVNGKLMYDFLGGQVGGLRLAIAKGEWGQFANGVANLALASTGMKGGFAWEPSLNTATAAQPSQSVSLADFVKEATKITTVAGLGVGLGVIPGMQTIGPGIAAGLGAWGLPAGEQIYGLQTASIKVLNQAQMAARDSSIQAPSPEAVRSAAAFVAPQLAPDGSVTFGDVKYDSSNPVVKAAIDLQNPTGPGAFSVIQSNLKTAYNTTSDALGNITEVVSPKLNLLALNETGSLGMPGTIGDTNAVPVVENAPSSTPGVLQNAYNAVRRTMTRLVFDETGSAGAPGTIGDSFSSPSIVPVPVLTGNLVEGAAAGAVESALHIVPAPETSPEARAPVAAPDEVGRTAIKETKSDSSPESVVRTETPAEVRGEQAPTNATLSETARDIVVAAERTFETALAPASIDTLVEKAFSALSAESVVDANSAEITDRGMAASDGKASEAVTGSLHEAEDAPPSRDVMVARAVDELTELKEKGVKFASLRALARDLGIDNSTADVLMTDLKNRGIIDSKTNAIRIVIPSDSLAVSREATIPVDGRIRLSKESAERGVDRFIGDVSKMISDDSERSKFLIRVEKGQREMMMAVAEGDHIGAQAEMGFGKSGALVGNLYVRIVETGEPNARNFLRSGDEIDKFRKADGDGISGVTYRAMEGAAYSARGLNIAEHDFKLADVIERMKSGTEEGIKEFVRVTGDKRNNLWLTPDDWGFLELYVEKPNIDPRVREAFVAMRDDPTALWQGDEADLPHAIATRYVGSKDEGTPMGEPGRPLAKLGEKFNKTVGFTPIKGGGNAPDPIGGDVAWIKSYDDYERNYYKDGVHDVPAVCFYKGKPYMTPTAQKLFDDLGITQTHVGIAERMVQAVATRSKYERVANEKQGNHIIAPINEAQGVAETNKLLEDRVIATMVDLALGATPDEVVKDVRISKTESGVSGTRQDQVKGQRVKMSGSMDAVEPAVNSVGIDVRPFGETKDVYTVGRLFVDGKFVDLEGNAMDESTLFDSQQAKRDGAVDLVIRGLKGELVIRDQKGEPYPLGEQGKNWRYIIVDDDPVMRQLYAKTLAADPVLQGRDIGVYDQKTADKEIEKLKNKTQMLVGSMRFGRGADPSDISSGNGKNTYDGIFLISDINDRITNVNQDAGRVDRRPTQQFVRKFIGLREDVTSGAVDAFQPGTREGLLDAAEVRNLAMVGKDGKPSGRALLDRYVAMGEITSDREWLKEQGLSENGVLGRINGFIKEMDASSEGLLSNSIDHLRDEYGGKAFSEWQREYKGATESAAITEYMGKFNNHEEYIPQARAKISDVMFGPERAAESIKNTREEMTRLFSALEQKLKSSGADPALIKKVSDFKDMWEKLTLGQGKKGALTDAQNLQDAVDITIGLGRKLSPSFDGPRLNVHTVMLADYLQQAVETRQTRTLTESEAGHISDLAARVIQNDPAAKKVEAWALLAGAPDADTVNGILYRGQAVAPDTSEAGAEDTAKPGEHSSALQQLEGEPPAPPASHPGPVPLAIDPDGRFAPMVGIQIPVAAVSAANTSGNPQAIPLTTMGLLQRPAPSLSRFEQRIVDFSTYYSDYRKQSRGVSGLKVFGRAIKYAISGSFGNFGATPTTRADSATQAYINASSPEIRQLALQSLEKWAVKNPEAITNVLTNETIHQLALRAVQHAKTSNMKGVALEKQVIDELEKLRTKAVTATQKTADFSIVRDGAEVNSPIVITVTKATQNAAERVAALSEISRTAHIPVTVRFADEAAKKDKFMAQVKAQMRLDTLQKSDLYLAQRNGVAVRLGVKGGRQNASATRAVPLAALRRMEKLQMKTTIVRSHVAKATRSIKSQAVGKVQQLPVAQKLQSTFVPAAQKTRSVKGSQATPAVYPVSGVLTHTQASTIFIVGSGIMAAVTALFSLPVIPVLVGITAFGGLLAFFSQPTLPPAVHAQVPSVVRNTSAGRVLTPIRPAFSFRMLRYATVVSLFIVVGSVFSHGATIGQLFARMPEGLAILPESGFVALGLLTAGVVTFVVHRYLRKADVDPKTKLYFATQM